MIAATIDPTRLCPHSLVDSPHSGDTPRCVGKSPSDPTAVREILACLDGSDLGRGIIPHAQLVAEALGARLTLLHVLEADTTGDAPADPLDWVIRQREARAFLADLVEKVGDLESGIASELVQGRAAEQICSWVEQKSIDLTVLCSHGSRGVTDWDLASTARKLVDRTLGSVLLVPAAAATERPVRYRRILVPLDGSPEAESVVPIAMRIAASQDAEVLLVHVVPTPEFTLTGPLDTEGAALQRRVVEYNHRIANAYLDKVRARLSHMGPRVRALVIGGGRVRRRLEHLIREERADLVVMSANGQTGRIDGRCGSVTEHAVSHATTPILVVRDRKRRRIRRVEATRAHFPERALPAGDTPL